jgi:hypothetical protein
MAAMKTGFDRRVSNKILVCLFLLFGIVDLGLWYVGHANNFAAVLGIAFLFGGLVLARSERKNKA